MYTLIILGNIQPAYYLKQVNIVIVSIVSMLKNIYPKRKAIGNCPLSNNPVLEKSLSYFRETENKQVFA